MLANRLLQRIAVLGALALTVGCSHRSCTTKGTIAGTCHPQKASCAPKECSKTYCALKNGCTPPKLGPCNPCAPAPVAAPIQRPAALPQPTAAVAEPVRRAEALTLPVVMPSELHLPPPSLKGYPLMVQSGPRPVAYAAPADPAELRNAPDHSWVIGELRYLHTRRAWQVRFAPVSVVDTYGGAFLLNSVEHMAEHFRDGMIVKVEGMLVEPGKRAPSPNYWVNKIHTLRNKAAEDAVQPAIVAQNPR